MAEMKQRLIRGLLAASCCYSFLSGFCTPLLLSYALLSVFRLNVGRYKSLNRVVDVGRAKGRWGKGGFGEETNLIFDVCYFTQLSRRSLDEIPESINHEGVQKIKKTGPSLTSMFFFFSSQVSSVALPLRGCAPPKGVYATVHSLQQHFQPYPAAAPIT